QSVAMYVLLFVVTAPVCEEILYRGLLVAWLRRVGWRDSAIWLAGSLIFGANHLIPLGLVWSAVMVVFGAILFAIRLRYDSLSPGWLVHFLFNAQPFLIDPLIAWLAPGLLPGGL
ncbi:MAG TPA: CPBP family intramembrane glutamic endopeptidase, partial [Terriglobales bacterium]